MPSKSKSKSTIAKKQRVPDDPFPVLLPEIKSRIFRRLVYRDELNSCLMLRLTSKENYAIGIRQLLRELRYNPYFGITKERFLNMAVDRLNVDKFSGTRTLGIDHEYFGYGVDLCIGVIEGAKVGLRRLDVELPDKEVSTRFWKLVSVEDNLPNLDWLEVRSLTDSLEAIDDETRLPASVKTFNGYFRDDHYGEFDALFEMLAKRASGLESVGLDTVMLEDFEMMAVVSSDLIGKLKTVTADCDPELEHILSFPGLHLDTLIINFFGSFPSDLSPTA
jgi:hypothetical protein